MVAWKRGESWRKFVGDGGEMMRCEMTWREDLDVIWYDLICNVNIVRYDTYVSGKVSVSNSVSRKRKRQTAVGISEDLAL